MDLPEPLVVSGLRKAFGRQVAVDEVSFTVPAGAVVGLLGPNGSGKSTTLHCLTGFHEPTRGQVWISGHPHREPAAKDSFGFFPDDLPVPDSLTTQETLTFHRRLRPRFDAEFATRLLGALALDTHLDKFVGDFSHGMRRKLQLALALAHHPRLLILDEPLRGLDPEAAALMNAVIAEFTAVGGAVLLATHDLMAAHRYCDSVVILSEGAVVASGPPQDISRRAGSEGLEDAFVRLTGLSDRVESARRTIADLIRGPALLAPR